ncbi:MAG: TIGR04283 family arsenosugar biosynthesis glycosyltransferase [Desulfobacterium sp.]|nr:TIGR04283 family arsenosugar biosynthesis glycosyltransferase [Desulfobacterium sp.]
MPVDARIMIFGRYPVAGKAKTRLIPALGPEGAARLHRQMTEHVVAMARSAVRKMGAREIGITFCCTGAPLKAFRAWLGRDLTYLAQPSGDLGARMLGAFKTALGKGAGSVIVIGSDLPDLTGEMICHAFKCLENNEIVLGPAADGGYYLLGMNALHPAVLSGIDWGTAHVLQQTCRRIKELGLGWAELPLLRDVDRPDDLSRLRNDPRFAHNFGDSPLISVIIPTLNEALALGPVLDCVQEGEAVETIVVDGGSQDQTRDIAARAGARVVVVSGGRAAQQNAGAALARGRWLLFLHGDTLLPKGYEKMIHRAMASPATVAGAFRFKTDDARTGMRLIQWTTNLRSCLLQWPYGDQGLFMEKRVFDAVGGFASLAIMEDFELVGRLRRRGKVVTLPHAVITSARRWQQVGRVRTTLINQMMIVGFLLGVPIRRLVRLYRSHGTGMKKKRSTERKTS